LAQHLPATTTSDWYRNAVIYQIYPRSFADANGDGIGDLAGITGKLDYLQSLGVNGIWLSPIYVSPMADFGYDVADYRAIDPTFGDLDDFDHLVAAAHARGIKVLMDLIPNHTSDHHAWFQESRSSRSNPKRDWYIWRDAKPDGSPPNNWESVFGGPSWTLDPHTNQYYLHSFLKEQPDLNWSNPAVQQAIQDVMSFWYDRGVDGFRVDAILFTSKDLQFRDNPRLTTKPKKRAVLDKELETAFDHAVGENLPDYIKVLTDVTKNYPERCLFLEAYPDKGDPAGYAGLYDFCDPEVSAPFYFGPMVVVDDWDARLFKRYIDEFETAIPKNGFAAYVLGNHDRSRLASRTGQHHARAMAVVQLSLPGAKFIYYGEELGMENVAIPPGKAHDPSKQSRDPERTPMQWSPQEHAGFTTGMPWLPVSQDYKRRNVATMERDERSILSLYRHMAKVGRHPALAHGRYEPFDTGQAQIFCFRRVYKDQQVLVMINFDHKVRKITPNLNLDRILASSTMTWTEEPLEQQITLHPWEAIVVALMG
jgi:alpha-glucosidase